MWSGVRCRWSSVLLRTRSRVRCRTRCVLRRMWSCVRCRWRCALRRTRSDRMFRSRSMASGCGMCSHPCLRRAPRCGSGSRSHPSRRSVALRCQRLCRGQGPGVPAIGLCVRSLVGPRRRYMLCLKACRSHVPVVFRDPLLGARLVLNPAWTAAEGHVSGIRNRVPFDHRAVNESIVDDRRIHVHHRRVVGEKSSPPFAAGEADAQVAAAVIHATVVAHVGTPIPIVKNILPVAPAPIAGRPQRADVGHRHPRAWHPEISIRPVGPVPRRPHHVWIGADRLFVNRQHRRSKPDTDQDARTRTHGNSTQQQSQQNPACKAVQSHESFLLGLLFSPRRAYRPA